MTSGLSAGAAADEPPPTSVRSHGIAAGQPVFAVARAAAPLAVDLDRDAAAIVAELGQQIARVERSGILRGFAV